MFINYSILNSDFMCRFHIISVLPGVERPAVVNKMNLTLSADHRVFEGKVASTYD